MGEVVFLVCYDDLNVLGPYLYATQMWFEKGYYVKVYSLRGKELLRPFRTKETFQHYPIDIPWGTKILCRVIGVVGAVLRRAGLYTSFSEWAGFLKMVSFAVSCFLLVKVSRAGILIATDPASLWAAAFISRRDKNHFIYSVRELFLSIEIKSFVQWLIKITERWANRNALFTIEFDETRAELIRKDHRLPRESLIIVPNAPPGEAVKEKGDYFRNKFVIEAEKKIAVYTGGIADYNLTYELIGTIEAWPENVVLVMHCWGNKKEVEDLKRFARKFDREVYFSTEILSFEEIHKIYASADIGFALYGDQDINHKYAGLSSGKMFNFLKMCVPVITNDTPECIRTIEKTGSGICVAEVSEIPHAIETILEKEDEFRRSCEVAFSGFNFETNYGRLIRKIEDLISNQ